MNERLVTFLKPLTDKALKLVKSIKTNQNESEQPSVVKEEQAPNIDDVLNNLSDSETEILQKFIKTCHFSLELPYDDEAVKSLLAKGIIDFQRNTLSKDKSRYTINYLYKNRLLEISEAN